jgi:hypothetical protein
MLTAYTQEVDDLEVAVAEILEQLQLGDRQLRYSAGILAFHPDFLETGAVKAVSDALPFASIGGTTSAVAVPGTMGDLMLSVTVLTSDDVRFEAGASVPIAGDPLAPVRDLYARLAPSPLEKPSLLLTIAPIIENIGGDDFVKAIDMVSGGVPLFGSLAFTHSPDFSGIETWGDGERHTKALTLVALFGEVEPEFHLTTIPDERRIHQKATITKAEKNQIQSINGLASLDYLETIGLAQNGQVTALPAIPFVLTLNDGSQVVRTVYSTTEEGFIVAFGDTPQGSEVGFAEVDDDFVIKTTGETIAEITATKAENIVIFSCVGRRWTLGVRTNEETKEMVKHLDKLCQFSLAYSGGEICPVRNRQGDLVNRFHNFSMIACVL